MVLLPLQNPPESSCAFTRSLWASSPLAEKDRPVARTDDTVPIEIGVSSEMTSATDLISWKCPGMESL